MTTSFPIEARAAEDSLFEDTLSYEASLPADFVAGPVPGHPAQAESLLHGIALVEDLRGEESGKEERGELPLLAQRMDAKLDLVLVLLGRLVRQTGESLPVRPLRWSGRGVRLDLAGAVDVPVGTEGLLRIQPSDWLPDHVELAATVIATATATGGASRLWLRFPEFPPPLEDALERHLFRQHRRQIAGSRRR